MDFTGIAQLISTVGFPIACCVYLIYSHTKENEKNAEMIEKLRDTVENNTKALIRLCAKMGDDDEKDRD